MCVYVCVCGGGGGGGGGGEKGDQDWGLGYQSTLAEVVDQANSRV